MQKQTEPVEKVIVNRMIAEIKKAGVPFVIKTHGGIYQVAGLPDIIAVAPGGRFLGIEAKRSTKHKPTALQVSVLKQINRAGGYACVAWTVGQAMDALHAATRGEAAPTLD